MNFAGAGAVKIIWEDADLLVVEKPVGLLVDAGVRENSTSAAHDQDLLGKVRNFGPKYEAVFAFHRLDRGTSGAVMLGKTRRYARAVTQAFEEKRIRKAYLAVVGGEWPATLNRVELPIEGRESLTTFRRLAQGTFAGTPASLIDCLPKTGRTHQIRIHCQSAGFPVLGDSRYGSAQTDEARSDDHALHAYRLDFRHPADGREISIRSAPEAWRPTWLENFDVERFWDQTFNVKSSV